MFRLALCISVLVGCVRSPSPTKPGVTGSPEPAKSGVSNQLTQADIDRVRDAGWSDEAIYDAITVCALFNFYNKWIDATGVSDMPAAAYAISGERLAKGYIDD
jgi:hypothetical protein